MEERRQSRNSIPCRCGRKLDIAEGAIVFTIGGRKITLNNIPHYHCSRCGKSVFDSELNVDGALRYAYKNGLDSIDWKQFDL